MNLRSFNKRTVNYQIFTFHLFVSTMIFTENPIYKLCISFASNIFSNTYVIVFFFLIFYLTTAMCVAHLIFIIVFFITRLWGKD